MEPLWLIFVLVFVLFIVIGQVFKLYLSYDFYNNSGLLVIKLWFIKIKNISFELQSKKIIIRTGKTLTSREYSFSDPKIKFYEVFSMELKEKIKFKKLSLYASVGVEEAANTALLTSVLNVALTIICSYLKNLKPTCLANVRVKPDYKTKTLDFNLFSKTSLSLFDFLYCLILAVLANKQST